VGDEPGRKVTDGCADLPTSQFDGLESVFKGSSVDDVEGERRRRMPRGLEEDAGTVIVAVSSKVACTIGAVTAVVAVASALTTTAVIVAASTGAAITVTSAAPRT